MPRLFFAAKKCLLWSPDVALMWPAVYVELDVPDEGAVLEARQLGIIGWTRSLTSLANEIADRPSEADDLWREIWSADKRLMVHLNHVVEETFGGKWAIDKALARHVIHDLGDISREEAYRVDMVGESSIPVFLEDNKRSLACYFLPMEGRPQDMQCESEHCAREVAPGVVIAWGEAREMYESAIDMMKRGAFPFYGSLYTVRENISAPSEHIESAAVSMAEHIAAQINGAALHGLSPEPGPGLSRSMLVERTISALLEKGRGRVGMARLLGDLRSGWRVYPPPTSSKRGRMHSPKELGARP